MSIRLDGQVAIVTGGGQGLGRSHAMALAERGAKVVVNDLGDDTGHSENAASVVSEIETAGGEAIAHGANVSNFDQVKDMVRIAMEEWGRIDILVNNAGTTRFINHSDLDGVTDDAWDEILGVNLKGPFQCTRAAAEALKASGNAEAVMTSSVAGIAGTGSSIPYCASKAALNNMTVTLARVLGPEIRVNAVAPGFIDGEWLAKGLGKAYEPIKQAMEGKSPLGRVVTPDDVAEAILSLVRGSDLVTGHILPIEGGVLIGS